MYSVHIFFFFLYIKLYEHYIHEKIGNIYIVYIIDVPIVSNIYKVLQRTLYKTKKDTKRKEYDSFI